MKTNVIYQGDCIKLLHSKVEQCSVDLIFADPPYNLSGCGLKWLGNKTGGDWYMMNEDWDTMSASAYMQFTGQWLAECDRVLKNKGSIYVAASYHNIAEVILVLKQMGYKINNIITWHKTNPMPNMTRRTFTHSTEFVVWAAKNKGWTFNYSKVKAINPARQKDGSAKQMRDLWEMPLVQGKERLRGSNGRALHPTQKPEEMLKRIVLASSRKGGIVLDPFMGSGTTACVAKKYGRQWIGMEQNKEYVTSARKRLAKIRSE